MYISSSVKLRLFYDADGFQVRGFALQVESYSWATSASGFSDGMEYWQHLGGPNGLTASLPSDLNLPELGILEE
jgi:hypothetical protein